MAVARLILASLCSLVSAKDRVVNMVDSRLWRVGQSPGRGFTSDRPATGFQTLGMGHGRHRRDGPHVYSVNFFLSGIFERVGAPITPGFSWSPHRHSLLLEHTAWHFRSSLMIVARPCLVYTIPAPQHA